jgi:hypothetical protein
MTQQYKGVALVAMLASANVSKTSGLHDALFHP